MIDPRDPAIVGRLSPELRERYLAALDTIAAHPLLATVLDPSRVSPAAERFAQADLGVLPTVSQRTKRRRQRKLARLMAEQLARDAAESEAKK